MENEAEFFLFTPPLYKQRYHKVAEIIRKSTVKKVQYIWFVSTLYRI